MRAVKLAWHSRALSERTVPTVLMQLNERLLFVFNKDMWFMRKYVTGGECFVQVDQACKCVTLS